MGRPEQAGARWVRETAGRPRGRWRRPAASPSPAVSSTSAAARGTAHEIAALSAAAALENLAVSVHRTARSLPFVRHGGRALTDLLDGARRHHEEHARRFDAAAVRAGGRARRGTDPAYARPVERSLRAVRAPTELIKLLLALEDLAARTYTKNMGEVDDPRLRRLFGSVAPVEAQHRAVLLALEALSAAGDDALTALPTDASGLPASVGDAGFPETFCPSTPPAPAALALPVAPLSAGGAR